MPTEVLLSLWIRTWGWGGGWAVLAACLLYLQTPAGFPKGEALNTVPADQRHGHRAQPTGGPHRGDPTLTVWTRVPYHEGGEGEGTHTRTKKHTQKHTDTDRCPGEREGERERKKEERRGEKETERKGGDRRTQRLSRLNMGMRARGDINTRRCSGVLTGL